MMTTAEKAKATIHDAQACRITRDEALHSLAAANIHGAFDSRGAYTGFDYTNQKWIAYNVDGSAN